MIAIVTDAKYRMTLPMIRCLGEAGVKVVCVAEDDGNVPVGFYSKWCAEKRMAASGRLYIKALADLCQSYVEEGKKPALLCVGGKTCDVVSANRTLFDSVAGVLLSSPDVLELANDKQRLLEAARSIGVPVPTQYTPETVRFPCIVKYRCGEKLGKAASKRYAILRSEEEFSKKYPAFTQHDEYPLLQEYLTGVGVGVSVLTDREGVPVDYICHRRLREYPASGGPSSLCESFFDPELVRHAVRLLQHIGFVGVGMVEFKAGADGVYKLMEINPRVWGSYALTRAAGSLFTFNWARLSAGDRLPPADLEQPPYRTGVKLQFLPSELRLAVSRKRPGIVADILNPAIHDGVFELGDWKGGLGYLKSLFGRRGEG